MCERCCRVPVPSPLSLHAHYLIIISFEDPVGCGGKQPAPDTTTASWNQRSSCGGERRPNAAAVHSRKTTCVLRHSDKAGLFAPSANWPPMGSGVLDFTRSSGY